MLRRDIADERYAHEMLKKNMEMEKENHDVTVRKLEKTQKEVIEGMNAVMLAKKEATDERIFFLTKSLNEAKVYRGENIVLKTRMEEMEKSSKSLVSSIGQLEKKNKNYTQQICQLSSTIDQFVMNNDKSTQQMSSLNDDVSAKKHEIDKMTAENRSKEKLLEEKIAQIDDLAEQLRRSKAENDEFKARISALEDDVSAKMTVIDEITAENRSKEESLEEKIAQSDDLAEQLRLSGAENDEFKARISALEDDLSDRKTVIDVITAESRNKEKILEEKIAESDYLAEQLRRSKAENDEVKAAKEDLVASNKEHITQITMLKDDVAVKTNMADKMRMEISEWRTKFEDEVTENVAVNEQFALSNAVNATLGKTIQDFESKNADHANELENLRSSLQEMVELNGELQSRIERVGVANDEHGEANRVSEEKNAELLAVVERLTNSINDEKSAHEAEVDEMKKSMAAERENRDAMFEETLREVTGRMNAEMLAQRESLALKMRMVKLTESLAFSRKDMASSMGRLEKDLNEEYKITTELKSRTEDLISKLDVDKNNSNYVQDVRDLLGSVRMIRSWQASHIQLISKLVFESKEQAAC
jgi:chromosome segregation ATPase